MTSPLQMVPDVEEGGRERGEMGAKKFDKEHKGKRNADKRETRGDKIGWRERLPGKRPKEREIANALLFTQDSQSFACKIRLLISPPPLLLTLKGVRITEDGK